MTTVTAALLNDGFMIECEGHSGYDEKGRDIVCAGVSALCMALEAMLEELSVEGCAEQVQKSLRTVTFRRRRTLFRRTCIPVSVWERFSEP